jgi:putative PIG3 family NAD(P)H quinone oxidoreductase
MYAITVREPGGPEVLEWAEVPDPVAGPGEVLLDVAASAVNRADIVQRKGHYPPPPGASELLGLECAGRIAALGEGVAGWAVGDEVCALLAGGGYAQKVAVPAAQLLPVPDGVDPVTAAGLPEVACTVWSNVVTAGRLAAGETFLVQGGTSGIGTHAIQVAKALGARVVATAAPQRADRCRELGADIVIDYHDDVPAELEKATDGHGADVILDNMGAKGLAANVDALAADGRLLIIGLQGGTKAELNINTLLRKRGSVIAMSLRGRPVDGPNGKGAVVATVRERLWPMLADGRVRPVVHATLPMDRAADAHRQLEAGGVVGKLLLEVPAG